MSNNTLLLTGGSGMVGRNILEHTRILDWRVLAPSSAELDLTNAETVKHYMLAESPDIVVHAAGLVGGIQANMANPVEFLERNISMGRNIIMASHNAGIRQFLNLASTCMYPRAAPNPLNEDLILTGELEPTNEGYALAKIMATRLCQYIRREDATFQYKTLIPCNIFGRYDKFSPKNSHLLPAIIHKIHMAKINGDPTVEIWGSGHARREFMFASDLADVVLRAASNMHTLPDLMNCGVGHDFSIKNYYQAVAEAIGWTGEFVHNITKPEGMMQKLCSTERQTNWGWSAPTSLSEGIRATYEFYLKEGTK